MAASFSIRDSHDTDADYAGMTAVFNAVWPEYRRDVAETRDRTRDKMSHGFFEQIVAEKGGEIIGSASISQRTQQAEPGRYDLHMTSHPTYSEHGENGVATALYRELERRLQAHGVSRVITSTRSDRPVRIQFLQDEGYQVAQRDHMSFWEPAGWSDAPFADRLARTAESGIQIATLDALQACDEQWLKKLWHLDQALRDDVPDVGPREKEPLARWQRRFQRPNMVNGQMWVALAPSPSDAAGAYVGMTRIGLHAATPGVGATGLTGTQRDYRRQGIGLALKVHALRWAIERGLHEVMAVNEADNPMYLLNVLLGFKLRYISLQYEKEWPL